MTLIAGSAGAETIENRDGQSLIATWWASDAVAPFAYTLDFGNTEHVHSGPYALRIDYNKANDPGSPYSFASAMGRWNLRNFDYLSFWVYNNGSPLKIRIHLEDKNGNPWESNWAGIEPETRTTNADWENLSVDLTRSFAATGVDFSCIQQMMFIVAPGDTNASGTFWLDDVTALRAPNSAPLETFESDFFGWSAGGAFSIVTNTTAQFQNSGAPASLGQRSLQINWGNKPATNWDNFIYTPQHDPAAPACRIGNYTNFTLNGNNTFEAWVKSTTDNNMPLLLKLSGGAGTSDVSTVTYTGAGAWQKLSWNFSAQSNYAAKLQTVWIFPYPNASDGGGTLYLDNIDLTGGSPVPLPLAPTNFFTTATVPDGDGVYTVKWANVSGATDYQLHESTNINFTTFSTITTNGTSVAFAKSATSAGMTYYYRVASRIISAGATNTGSFTAPAMVTVKTPPVAARRFEVLDNFDGQKEVAAWWGSDPSAPYVYTQDFVNTQQVHSGTRSMRVDFDKSNETNSPYAFFSAMGSFNLRNFDYLSFWVYNTGTPLRIKIRVEDKNGNPFESDWAGIFPQTRTAAADWENLVVDLTRTFSATNLDMTKITQVMFMVEPGSITNRGTFWLDDIEFHRAANSAPIEIFEPDFYGWSSGGPFTIATNTSEWRNDGTQTGLGQASLCVAWTNKTADYSNVAYTPRHDTAAPACRIGAISNFAANGNSFVELWVKSTTETNLPILLKFDNADVSVQNYTGAGAWQRLTWDFSGVAGATNVTTMYLYPYPNQADGGGKMYIDDLNLIGGSIAAVPYAPTTLLASAVSSGNYTLSWDAVTGVTGYVVQEALVSDFTTISTCYTSLTASASIAKSPFTGGGTYYYRVRSFIATNFGNCGAPISVIVIPVANLQSEKVDGFDQDGIALTWWAPDGAYPYAYDIDFGNTEHVHGGAFAAKVTYNKANDPGPYTFFSALGQYNLRNYDYLSFWVYNTGATLKIKIRIEDKNGNPFESDWAGFTLQTKTAAADWENIVFDLTRTFSATNLDLTQITQIMFMVAPGSTNEAGQFWLDDIQFSRAVNSAPLEPFEVDNFGWSAGAPFTIAVTSNQCHNDGSANGLGQQSLQVSWTNKSVDYSNFIYIPGHDPAAPSCRIGAYTNFALNGNGYAELWVKSATETNMPILLKFDDYDVGVQNYTGGGAWQRLVWDYRALSRATNVQTVWLFPYPNAADSGGTMYVDDLNLIGGNTPLVPSVPPNLAASRVTMGSYTVLWSSVTGATGYQLQESTAGDFQTTTATYTITNLQQALAKSPTAQFGTYYYRVRSGVVSGYGSYSKAIAVYVAQVTTNNGAAVNSSYPTDCAEVDNLSVGLKYTNTAAFRITVTHPLYYTDYGTNVLNERGADFSQCQFTDRRIWIVGTNDGSWWEFKPSGFGPGDVYYPIDNPMDGIDEAWSNCPQEINHDWMQDQFFAFTAHELGDVDLEYKIGSDLEVSFALINGTLAITGSAKGASGWVGLGTKVFNATTRTNIWSVPDFTWAQGADTNRIWLRVLPSTQSVSQPGSWAIYDYIELRKRAEAGDRLITNVFDNGNIVVNAYDVDFWWRTPETMHLQVLGGLQTNCDFFTIIKRVPETTYTNYSQVMVMYQDGYVRLLPSPPPGVDWTPFGASVVLGASPDVSRPFAAVTNVVIDPKDLSMDITFADHTSCHVEMWVDEQKNVLDVSKITYNTSTSVFTRLRSMWVCDGKADLDRVETASGVYPISENWQSLSATWWQFFKESPTYHNTYCPDFRMEIMDPSPAFLVRQCEDYDTQTNFALSFRANGRNSRVMTSNKDLGSEATYVVSITQDRPDVTMLLRYADDDGGNNGTYPGNHISVYVDGQLKDQTITENTAGWEDFETTPALSLGTLTAGNHTIRIVVGALTFGCDLDEFQLVSQPVTPWTKQTILTRQGESYNTGTNQVIAWRTNAVGGQSVHVDQAGGSVQYTFTAPSTTTNTYIQLRYSDDVGPTKLDLYVDGFLAARYPTEDGTSWTDWRYSSEMFLGTLTAGTHQLSIVFYPETYGADIDQFELYWYQAP